MQRTKNAIKKYEVTTNRTVLAKKKWKAVLDAFYDSDEYFEHDMYLQEQASDQESEEHIEETVAMGESVEEARLDMYDLDLNGEEFIRMNLSKIKINSCTFRYANLEQSDLHSTEIILSDFHGANLRDVTLYDSEIVYTDFSHACFIRADFQGCKIESCNLSNCNLSGANMLDCEFNVVDLHDSIYDDSTKLPFSELEAEKKGMKKAVSQMHSAS